MRGSPRMIFNPGICPKSHLTKASDTGRKLEMKEHRSIISSPKLRKRNVNRNVPGASRPVADSGGTRIPFARAKLLLPKGASRGGTAIDPPKPGRTGHRQTVHEHRRRRSGRPD